MISAVETKRRGFLVDPRVRLLASIAEKKLQNVLAIFDEETAQMTLIYSKKCITFPWRSIWITPPCS